MTKKMTVLLLGFLALAAFVPPLANAGTQGSWTGWITIEKCGAKGAKAERKSCLKKYVDNGEKLVFYNTADEKLYTLDKQDVVKEHIGHEVKVTGELEGNAIMVESIEAAKTM